MYNICSIGIFNGIYMYTIIIYWPYIIFMLRKTDFTGRFIILFDYGIVVYVIILKYYSKHFVVWLILLIFLIIYAVTTNNVYLMSNTETQKVEKVNFEASCINSYCHGNKQNTFSFF